MDSRDARLCKYWSASRWVALVILVANSAGATYPAGSQEDSSAGTTQLLGRVAPAWSVRGWANSKAVAVDDLRGKVVLLRFMSDNPIGAASLNEWHQTYRARGFTVVGLYTPSPMPAEVNLEEVRRLASSLGFEFPVGLDSRWETLNRYWLDQPEAEMTAATFLIDRKGVIRYIQPDGRYEKNSSNRATHREFEAVQAAIERLLKDTEEASK